MIIAKTIRIDFNRPYTEPIKVNQHEKDARVFDIYMSAGSLPIDVTDASVVFYAKKPDGHIVYNGCIVIAATTGHVTYKVTEQTCAAAGELRCWLLITKTGEALRSMEFTVTVNAGEDDSEAIESTSEFTALEAALALAEVATITYSAYDSEASYTVGMKVVYNGSSYVNIAPCTNVLPTDTDYWLLIASKGDTGATGDVTAEATAAKEGAEAARDLAEGYKDAAIAAFSGIAAYSPANVNYLNLEDADYRSSYYCNSTSGAVTANATYWCSGFVPVTAGDVIVITRLPVSLRREITKFRYVTAFNASKAVIAGSGASVAASEYTVPAGVSFIRVTGYVSSPEPMIENIKERGILLDFLAYGESNAAYVWNTTLDVFLPPVLYVAIGRTVEIYNRAVCPQANKYRFSWVSSVGIQTERKISITGATAATTYLYLWIFDDANNIRWSRVIKLIVVAATSATLSVCPIGDSLTNGKAWLAEMINLDNNLSYVGSTAFNFGDAGGTPRTGHHEGRSGWAAKTYMTLAIYGETNPFWDATLNEGAGGFSWAYYVTNTLSATAPDAVQIFLGTNGLDYDPDENAGYIQDMVDAIRADAPTMPIYIVTPQYKAYNKSASTVYGYNSYGEAIKMFRLCVKLYELLYDYDDLYIIPLTQCFDSEYNFNSGTVAVNPRHTTTEPAIPDPVHPARYWQMADVMFSVLSAHTV